MRGVMLAALCAIAALQPASASKPVLRTMTGCVSNGSFVNEGGYTIRIRREPGKLLDLARWNGKRLRITGNLLPGDNLYLIEAPAVLGACR